MSLYCTCLSLLVAQLCVLGAARFLETSHVNLFRSDYTFSHEAAGWLKLHRVPVDWHTARIQCHYEGAVLASPLDAGLWSALAAVIKANPDYTLFFSGVSSTFNEGVYSSVEGVPLEQLHIHWGNKEPNNLEGKEQCLAYKKQGDNVTVHDVTCARLLQYICYRPASIPDEVTECGTVDKEYKLQTQTEHCYKFHALALKWAQAARVCRAEGAYLVDIDSQREANLLVDMFSDKKTRYSSNPTSALVGLRVWGDNSWWTIHGKKFDESRSSLWEKGEPISYGGKDQCGSVFIANGTLNDVSCDEKFAFICEKHPDSLLNRDGDVF